MPNQTVMDIDQLLDRVKSYNAEADLAIVRKAYEFSAKVHEGQRRRSGEPATAAAWIRSSTVC